MLGQIVHYIMPNLFQLLPNDIIQYIWEFNPLHRVIANDIMVELVCVTRRYDMDTIYKDYLNANMNMNNNGLYFSNKKPLIIF